ncbi:MAG: 16S rRNA (cytidine(1402)-2'-O)-methyltransferase [Kineosporiaceae bacterium]
MPDTTPGRLVLAATPIGDHRDASPRLIELLAQADVVAAEDTRRLRQLAAALGVVPRGRVLSFHEHNETARAAELVDAVASGLLVVVVTDAGMPSVSDPGLRAVRAVVDAGLTVTAAPGPSAVLTALALSGLPTDRFCFEGFPPRKDGPLRRVLADLADEPRTMVFFEAPHRVAATLAAMAEVLGADRPAALCRELTKTYEQVRRATLGELARGAVDDPPRGEICLVVAGRERRALTEEEAGAAMPALVARVRERVAGGERMKDAAAAVAADAGVPKRALYDAVARG